MRTPLLIALVCLLALPAVGAAALTRKSGDGTLSVDSGYGKVMLEARGGIIGRIDRGVVTINDLTPDDVFEPVVFGGTLTRELPSGAVVYRGANIRFRLIGGAFRVHVNGNGIDLSAVGHGLVALEGDGRRNPGSYSLEGDDCRLPRVRCALLPDTLKRFRLGDGLNAERRSERSP